MEQQFLNQSVDTVFANMETFAQKEGIIGKPVTQGDKTFLPVLSVTLGYGGGDTQSKSTSPNATSPVNTGAGNMSGGALGLGAKLTADAIIIINKDDVSMVPISASGAISQMVDKVPQILSSLSSSAKSQSGSQNTQQNQQNKQTTSN